MLIKVFNFNEIKPVFTFKSGSYVLAMTNLNKFDNHSIVCGLFDGHVIKLNLLNDSIKVDKKQKIMDNPVWDILHVLNNSYNYIISWHKNASTVLWNTGSLTINKIFNKEHQNGDNMHALKYYKNDMFLTLSKVDKEIKLWSFNSISSLYTFNFGKSEIYSMAVFDDFNTLVAFSEDFVISYFDLISKKLVKTEKAKSYSCDTKTYKDSKYVLIKRYANKYLNFY